MDMIGGELGELGDDLVCRRSGGEIFEHVVDGDPCTDEGWLPTSDAGTGVDECSEIHIEMVPVSFVDPARCLTCSLCHGTSMAQVLTFLGVRPHSKAPEFQGFSSVGVCGSPLSWLERCIHTAEALSSSLCTPTEWDPLCFALSHRGPRRFREWIRLIEIAVHPTFVPHVKSLSVGIATGDEWSE